MANSNVVPLRQPLGDAGPQGGAVDPNDPIVVAASGQVITAKSPPALVKKLQLLLNAWGFAAGAADGKYGARTADAVRGLQAKLGVPVDGLFGPQTAQRVSLDLASKSSVLRGNLLTFSPPLLLPPKPTRPATPAVPAPEGEALPATQPAVGGGVPWVWLLGGAAALLFLYSRFRNGTGEGTVLAPPGSVVADLDYEGEEDEGHEEEAVEEDVVEEEPPPKPKRKRKPRKKKAKVVDVSEVKTPDEVLPPADEVIDAEFHEVE